jgi:hypothetical protein
MVGGWLLSKSCEALLFLFRMIWVRAETHLNIIRGDSK